MSTFKSETRVPVLHSRDHRGAAGKALRLTEQPPCQRSADASCGDCHLLNFGLFATPKRHLIFDINDVDETPPAPGEWAVKRLAVSFETSRTMQRLRMRSKREKS